MRQYAELFEELFEHVLSDEEPLFVSDEATIYDVSSAPPEELLKRLSEYYGAFVSLQDLKQPLWQLLLLLRPGR